MKRCRQTIRNHLIFFFKIFKNWGVFLKFCKIIKNCFYNKGKQPLLELQWMVTVAPKTKNSCFIRGSLQQPPKGRLQPYKKRIICNKLIYRGRQLLKLVKRHNWMMFGVTAALGDQLCKSLLQSYFTNSLRHL
ncbi:MAG: hypothetical protein CM15mP110_0010 [Alphaproteobacteria bacterium]|nr:MAG: hypothetical protein CM15mP110_0010 [Alphaproteobacteria bacterium]